ncbi:MAG: component of SufBCD complex [Pseudomonadota bacterium]
MDFSQTIFEAIDMRSFSNLWFWIALAVLWSTASHWVLGVPFDMVTRARRQGGQAAEDVRDMVRVNINRLLYISDVSGLWLVGVVAFLLTGLAVLGWTYWVEFAQAVFLLALPMTAVGALNVRTARIIFERVNDDADLYKRLARHRTIVQAIGMVAIFITALWGMYMNLAAGRVAF